jgi:NADH:ubiquinone oxidoreductase subunit E
MSRIDLNPQEPRYLVLRDYTADRVDRQTQEAMVYFLKQTQEIFGLVPVFAQLDASEICEFDMKIIKALIMRFPSLQGESVTHIVKVCVGDRCKGRGSPKVLSAISDSLGISVNQMSPDGKYFLKTQKCFGFCREGINVLVDNQMIHHVTLDMVDEICKKVK